MMSGIQKAVRSNSAIQDTSAGALATDFKDRIKYNNLLSINPSSLAHSRDSSCKFRDYAPKIFALIRHHFGITDTEYIRSLGV